MPVVRFVIGRRNSGSCQHRAHAGSSRASRVPLRDNTIHHYASSMQRCSLCSRAVLARCATKHGALAHRDGVRSAELAVNGGAARHTPSDGDNVRQRDFH